MRGKALAAVSVLSSTGITPAHAGKRLDIIHDGALSEDHPRACGEKTKKIPYHRLFPLRSAPFSFSFA